ncbi:hypothetical protein SERLA73DRAFT_176607 [Serpula lacrymans var. lacrymans S7.3]|uniref:Uncharacterized protein n=2 Tax=Serpula lacrymans var. lacrymans TaxID=341189 RepID=F8PNB4_SERL3|nr:uncharacterized protein SERLADRAFT_459697 [Serpula lacrymans var. lacrymans S7.9]EGO03096.1 hypothetical protein SERLA73DRAFT_176607 [Serpula lacrymans var. lacrymans S7.3]EGO28858.1 hypothetical protein SERLADRAFT_459697 [Serpula lacrymans var. lacrymans S7.9]
MTTTPPTPTSSSSSSPFPSLFNSTFTTPPPIDTPSSTPSDSSDSDSVLTSSSALYLYTFLATLVLLLGVSSAIVLRSLVLRRRHQRIVEEAIRNGTWIPSTNANANNTNNGRGRRAKLGEKPKLWEVKVGEGDDCGGMGDTGGDSGDERNEKGTNWNWNHITPISASYLPNSQASPSFPRTSSPSPSTEFSTHTSVPRFLRPFTRFRLPFPFTASASPQSPSISSSDSRSRSPRRPRSPPGTNPAAISTPAAVTASGMMDAQGGDPSTVRLAVLIAMPDPTRSTHSLSHSHSLSRQRDSTCSTSKSANRDVGERVVEFGLVDVVIGQESEEAP